MTSIPRSGQHYPNRFARVMLQSLIDVAGENGMHAVFRLAGLPELIDSLPAENDLKEFDTADLAAVFQTIHEIYGFHGGRSLAFKAGQMTFTFELESLGPLYGAVDLPLQDIPVKEKVQKGLEAVCAVFNQLSDQHVDLLYDTASHEWIFVVHDCAICHGRQSAEPICAFTEGLLDQALFHFSGGSRLAVQEIVCAATGSETCQYLIQIPQPENPPFTV